MNELQLLQRVVDETTRVIESVPEGAMTNPSPCEGWTVRDRRHRSARCLEGRGGARPDRVRRSGREGDHR